MSGLALAVVSFLIILAGTRFAIWLDRNEEIR
jgi:hypothetical protein